MYRMLCAWLKMKLSAAKPSQLKIQLLVWGCIFYVWHNTFDFLLLSPCSGIVISGYSKTLTDKSLIKNLANAIIPYTKFKKMYKVDTTGEFKGK